MNHIYLQILVNIKYTFLSKVKMKHNILTELFFNLVNKIIVINDSTFIVRKEFVPQSVDELPIKKNQILSVK